MPQRTRAKSALTAPCTERKDPPDGQKTTRFILGSRTLELLRAELASGGRNPPAFEEAPGELLTLLAARLRGVALVPKSSSIADGPLGVLLALVAASTDALRKLFPRLAAGLSAARQNSSAPSAWYPRARLLDLPGALGDASESASSRTTCAPFTFGNGSGNLSFRRLTSIGVAARPALSGRATATEPQEGDVCVESSAKRTRGIRGGFVGVQSWTGLLQSGGVCARAERACARQHCWMRVDASFLAASNSACSSLAADCVKASHAAQESDSRSAGAFAIRELFDAKKCSTSAAGHIVGGNAWETAKAGGKGSAASRGSLGQTLRVNFRGSHSTVVADCHGVATSFSRSTSHVSSMATSSVTSCTAAPSSSEMYSPAKQNISLSDALAVHTRCRS